VYSGFTLVELAIVLVIVALLTGGLLLGISAQRNAAESVDAQRQLENLREALLGYAMANGRLPCPAQANLPNTDDNAGKALTPPCDSALQHGVLPWKTLGLPETDPWGNRFTYFVSSYDSNATPSKSFAKTLPTGALASFTLDTSGNANVKDIWNAGANIASDLPAVIVSHGNRGAGAYQPTGAQLPASADPNEAENSDADLNFVSRTPSDTFDDLVTWIVPSILKSKMVAAGRLP
jgi:prepilin-type N-terminal cleavage/methylation domain-containing protein